VDAVASYASMVATLSASYSHSVDRSSLGPYWSGRLAQSLRDFAAVRADQPHRFIDVLYDDLVVDPRGQARAVLAALGFEVGAADDEAFSLYLERNRAERGRAHSYQPADFGLAPGQVEPDFAFYTEAYL